MKNLSMLAFFIVILFSVSTSAATNNQHVIAICEGNFSRGAGGIHIEFTENLDPVTALGLEEGAAIQDIYKPDGTLFMNFSNRTELKRNGDTVNVKMYVHVFPDMLFASFDIDLSKPSTVEVYAQSARALWVTLSCIPQRQ